MRFTIEPQGLENLGGKFQDLQQRLFGYALPRDLDAAFQIGLQEAQRNVPVRTGALRGSGHIRSSSPLQRELSFPLNYAVYTNQHHPTKAGWFDKAVDYINQTLPAQAERSFTEQVGLTNRK
jgi:hypothetical protein